MVEIVKTPKKEQFLSFLRDMRGWRGVWWAVMTAGAIWLGGTSLLAIGRGSAFAWSLQERVPALESDMKEVKAALLVEASSNSKQLQTILEILQQINKREMERQKTLESGKENK